MSAPSPPLFLMIANAEDGSAHQQNQDGGSSDRRGHHVSETGQYCRTKSDDTVADPENEKPRNDAFESVALAGHERYLAIRSKTVCRRPYLMPAGLVEEFAFARPVRVASLFLRPEPEQKFS